MSSNFTIGTYEENLIDSSAVAATVAGTRAVKVGGTAGSAYGVVVAGDGGCTLGSGNITMTMTVAEEMDGTFVDCGVTAVKAIAAETAFAEGKAIAVYPIAYDVPSFGKGSLAFSGTGNSGNVKFVLMTG